MKKELLQTVLYEGTTAYFVSLFFRRAVILLAPMFILRVNYIFYFVDLVFNMLLERQSFIKYESLI